MHWADVVAKKLKETSGAMLTGGKNSGVHTIATGITPSGHIHLGNMREILTGDIIQRAAKDLGLDVRLIYIGDTIDPLRKVYPFLDASYAEHVGKPLCDIPCPCGSHGSYSHHFLEPFLGALDRLGVEHETYLSHEMYKKGMYFEAADKVLTQSKRVSDLLNTISSRDLEEGYVPYMAQCEKCGNIRDTEATAYSRPFVSYRCKKCGNEGKVNIEAGNGKLPWRLDWPARWWFLGVTCEPFGKDHAAAGSSYDTGSAIVREIFDREPPVPCVYEWIQLKGKGAMHSSTGIAVTAEQMLKMTPPEVMRFLLTKQNPGKHIDFDPGLGILNLVDEYDRYERVFYGKEKGNASADQNRAFVLAQSSVKKLRDRTVKMGILESGDFSVVVKDDQMPAQIPYKNLVCISQITSDKTELTKIMKRAERIDMGALTPEEQAGIWNRTECVKYWLKNYAPDEVKFALVAEVGPEVKAKFTPEDKNRLAKIRENLGKCNWDAEEIHRTVYDTAESLGEKGNAYFGLMYRILLAKERGPRLGFFLSTLDRDYVLKLLDQALN